MKTLLSEVELQAGVARMAVEIAAVYGERPLTIVGVLTGSVVLLADLIRLLEMPLRVGVLQASSYRSGTTRGQLTINSEMMLNVAEREVLVVDDIFDTGHTLVEVVAKLKELSPTSVKTAVLLRKQGRQEVDFKPEFVAFDIPDKFVVGYGLDYADQYRNLRHLAVLEPEDLADDRS
ncbi:MAG: hypoxanthine phosphoribosyltransferase [Planctomycetia bacterium]|nr:hypoxanthine phosphoribosyltransferase [Planctomycetia bacterium]